MLKAVVYKSSTGHTERYARLLGDKLNIPYYTIKEARGCLNKNDEIIYLGWVCASVISGIGKVKNRYMVKCFGAVGLYPEREEYIRSLESSNKTNAPLFYLRGGIDYTKLNGIKKRIIKMVGKAVESDNKPESKELKEVFNNGADFVSEKNLEKMMEYIRG